MALPEPVPALAPSPSTPAEQRKAALEQMILQLSEDKDQDQQEIKKVLLKGLNQLLALSQPKQATEEKQAEDKNEATVLEDLRKYLREEILEKETQATQALCDQAFQIQKMLAKHWPLNQFDNASQAYLDPITFDPIENLEDAIPISSGHLVLKSTLNDFYSRPVGYSRGRWRHPMMSGVYLSQREVDDIISQEGINIRQRHNPAAVLSIFRNPLPQNPPPNRVPAPNPPRVYRSFREQWREQHNFSLFDNAFAGFLQRRYRHNRQQPNTPTNNEHVEFLAKLGGGIAIMSVFAALIFGIIFTCVLSSINPLIPLGILLLTSLVTGAIAAIRAPAHEKRNKFAEGLITGFLGSALVLTLGLIGPAILAGLGAASAISVGSLATATSIWSFVHPFLPTLPLIVGLIREKFRPGALTQMWNRLNLVVFAPIVTGFTVLVGETARLVSRITDAIKTFVENRRHQRHLQEIRELRELSHHLDPAHRNDPRNQNELSANSRIHRGLRVKQVGPAPDSSPVAEQPENPNPPGEVAVAVPAPDNQEERARAVCAP